MIVGWKIRDTEKSKKKNSLFDHLENMSLFSFMWNCLKEQLVTIRLFAKPDCKMQMNRIITQNNSNNCDRRENDHESFF